MQISAASLIPRLILITVLNAVPFATGNAQTYFFDNYSTQQEFESKVYCIVQDRNSYVWLGTPTGAWRFDGKSFKNYSQADGLAEGSVRSLFIDSHEYLWFGHEGGGITRHTGKGFEHISLQTAAPIL
jgi:ligand-binding sensor domain-containing protein